MDAKVSVLDVNEPSENIPGTYIYLILSAQEIIGHLLIRTLQTEMSEFIVGVDSCHAALEMESE